MAQISTGARPSWRRCRKLANRKLADKRYADSLVCLLPYARAVNISGYGQHVRKIVAHAPAAEKARLREIIQQEIMPAYATKPYTAEGKINLMYLQAVLGDNKAFARTMREESVRLDGRRDFSVLCDVARGLLINSANSNDDIASIFELMERGSLSVPGFRPIVARLMRAAVLRAHSFGTTTESASPLLEANVFASFLEARAHGEGIASHLPERVLDWFREGQRERPREKMSVEEQTRPKRVLFVSHTNWNFLPQLVKFVEQAGMEVRFLPFDRMQKEVDCNQKNAGPTMREMLFACGPHIPESNEALASVRAASPWAMDLLEWCDVVFVEWWNTPAIWFSRYAPDDKDLIVRLHSYEAFSIFPTFSNIRRVDKTIFIAPHIRDIFAAVNSHLDPDMSKSVVIPNFRKDLDSLYNCVKSEDASWTLGMVQYATSNKDPVFALNVLKELLKQDSRWKLRLAGSPWARGYEGEDGEYRKEFERALEPIAEHVILEGFVTDIPKWQESVGYMLSTSHREGSHESIVEGMVAGSIPVLRKWPMMALFGAPESVFPNIPSFDTPSGMADYIADCHGKFQKLSAYYRNVGKGQYSNTEYGDTIVDLMLRTQ